MIEIKPIPVALLILLAFFAAIIFFVFKLARQYGLPLVKKRKTYRLFDLWLFRMEFMAWALFLVFALYRLLISSPYLSLFFVAIIIMSGRAFWKDFIPGLLFRFEKNAEVGDSMRYDNGNCTIESIGQRNLHLRNKAGEIIILPYSHVSEAIIAKSVQKSNLYQFTFKVEIKSEDPSAASALLEKYIQECPWSIPSRQPIIHSLANGIFEITSFATDENAAEKQRLHVNGRVKAGEV